MAEAKENGYFWNSDNADRVYDADSFSDWLKKFFTTGVFNGDLGVTPAGGMSVSIGSGYCNIEGKVRIFEGTSSLTLDPASASYPRIDSVVVTCDYTERSIDLGILKGNYSGTNPVASELTRNASKYQIAIAQILVGAGATTITAADITDTRMDSNLCGLVAGTVQEINIDGVTNQYSQMFEDWFKNIKDKLSGDTAGNLQNQIDELSLSTTKKIDDLNETTKEKINAVGKKVDDFEKITTDSIKEVDAKTSVRLATKSLTAAGGTVSWTDASITDTSLIEVYATIPNISPADYTVSGTTLTVTFDEQEKAFDVCATVRK